MTWTSHLVLCFAVLSSSIVLCDGARLEEFLQEKQEYLQEVDRLFYTFDFNNTSHQLSADANTNGQHQSIRPEPLSAPDWSADSSLTYDLINAEEVKIDEYDLDESQPMSFEEENYRPRAPANGRSVRLEGPDNIDEDENVFSGDSGLFLKEKIGDDDERYEDSGSGDSRIEETTFRQTTLVLQESSTSIPVESNNQCGVYLKTEIISCVELSLNMQALLHEMSSHSLAESGYYSVTSNKYFTSLFLTCVSTIIRPPSCSRNNNVLQSVIDGVVLFAHRHKGRPSDNVYVYVDQSHFNCFHTHLQLLRSCLNAGLSNVRLEGLVRMVMVRAKKVSVKECLDLEEVRHCVVGAMSECEDLTSVERVEDMFDATAREFTTCGESTTKDVDNAAVVASSGVFVILAMSVLVLGFQKQLLN